ncbi:DUF268 domain-containing protein [Lachnospiraceae bacterium 54-11]
MNRLLIWGTGKLAKSFIDNGYNGEIIGFIETNKSADSFMNKPVYSSYELPNEYDYIIVANSYVLEIYNLCLKLNIDMEKLIFLYEIKHRAGCTNSNVIKEILSEKSFIDYCVRFGLFDNTFVNEDASKYENLNKRPNFKIQEQYMWPVITDKYDMAGTIRNYFWQDLWAAKLIIKSGIKKHFDIGSRLDGFIAHLLAANIDVTMIDIRKFPGEIEQLNTIVDDATSLHQITNESIESMSALCSLEHFGLGRYGDSVDPEACFKCFASIQKKLKKGGKLYISLPIGKERVEFNAHRVFYPSTVVECFSSLVLKEYSCMTEERIEYNVDLNKYDNDSHNGEHRYGLFYFEKCH